MVCTDKFGLELDKSHFDKQLTSEKSTDQVAVEYKTAVNFQDDGH